MYNFISCTRELYSAKRGCTIRAPASYSRAPRGVYNYAHGRAKAGRAREESSTRAHKCEAKSSLFVLQRTNRWRNAETKKRKTARATTRRRWRQLADKCITCAAAAAAATYYIGRVSCAMESARAVYEPFSFPFPMRSESQFLRARDCRRFAFLPTQPLCRAPRLLPIPVRIIIREPADFSPRRVVREKGHVDATLHASFSRCNSLARPEPSCRMHKKASCRRAGHVHTSRLRRVSCGCRSVVACSHESLRLFFSRSFLSATGYFIEEQ
ncbi:unnamed protein product [Trichogramma brassicae]|uniref:Uncharacterized protein n=1 Tax=Trichogramma brassicae TaxID=86971 RepID=A0A6H5HWK0_9HYME|nr:unnamed protein product [Trichogramma brassicae]